MRTILLPSATVLCGPALLLFQDLVQPFLVEVGRGQTYTVSLNRRAGIRVGERSEISPRTAPSVAVLPKVRELGLLPPNAVDRALGT